MNANKIQTSSVASSNYDVPNKLYVDTGLALKANVSDVPTNTALTTLANRVTAVEGSSSQNATDISTVSSNLSGNYYNKTASDARFKPVAQIETKIQNSTINTKLECSGDNAITIKANG